MMSGMRNAPPISTSSPRETSTSLPRASVLSSSSTAAALLFTAVAASPPVNSRSRPSRWSSRSPRSPLPRSYSRLVGRPMATATACTASGGASARPRLVCSTVPVRLKTGRRCGRASASSSAWQWPSNCTGSKAWPSADARQRASRARATASTALRPCRSARLRSAGRSISRSSEGGRSDAGLAVEPAGSARVMPGWRKSVGVEPTWDRMAAPPDFADRTPHRGTILFL